MSLHPYRYEALNDLIASLNETAVISDAYKSRLRMMGTAIAAQAHAAGIAEGKKAAELPEGELVKLDDGRMLVARDKWVKLVQDHNDMMSAAQTYFVRCLCGRLREPGIICPTNREGGECEAGE